MDGKQVSLIVFGLTAAVVFGIIIHGEMTTDEDRILITNIGDIKHTIIEQSFNYPENPPDIKVKFIELLPKAETGWHTHSTPIISTILHGDITVSYCLDGEECDNILVHYYTAGDTFVEAINMKHNGVNEGVIPVKIHVVTLE